MTRFIQREMRGGHEYSWILTLLFCNFISAGWRHCLYNAVISYTAIWRRHGQTDEMRRGMWTLTRPDIPR